MLQLPDDLFGMDIFGGYQPDSGAEQCKKYRINKKKHPDLERKRKNKQARASRRKNRK